MPRGDRGQFRCDECRKVYVTIKDGGTDCGPGGSNWLCWVCQERIENLAAVIESRIERKHGVLIDSTALHMLAHY